MPTVDLLIAGRVYDVACRDGDEDKLREVGATVDAKVQAAIRAMGGIAETRQLLFAALMLADELRDARAGIAPPPSDPAAAQAVERLSQRVEALADALEQRGATS